jgi:hypothetical protein
LAKQIAVQVATSLQGMLAEIKQGFPKLALDDVFVLWYLLANVTDKEAIAAEAVSGGARDKGFDALIVEDAAWVVTVVQGKYRRVRSRFAPVTC